jgi:hypothetical protein
MTNSIPNTIPGGKLLIRRDIETSPGHWKLSSTFDHEAVPKYTQAAEDVSRFDTPKKLEDAIDGHERLVKAFEEDQESFRHAIDSNRYKPTRQELNRQRMTALQLHRNGALLRNQAEIVSPSDEHLQRLIRTGSEKHFPRYRAAAVSFSEVPRGLR